MSKAPDIASRPWPSHARQFRFDASWVTRPVFGFVLAAIALGAIAFGAISFAVVIGLVVAAAMREWQRMVTHAGFARELVAAIAFIFLSLALMLAQPSSWLSWASLGAGACIVYFSAALQDARPLWLAGGVLYLGVPALMLLAMREIPVEGAWLIAGLLLTVWATDTAALLVGKLIGGPRLAPILSPNKTWAGTLGGLVAGALVSAVYVGTLGGHGIAAGFYGAAVAIIAHAGDLFESWVKRQFHLKDSGGLIPGHGGVLDRIDSTLSAATFVGIAMVMFGVDPLFGARP